MSVNLERTEEVIKKLAEKKNSRGEPIELLTVSQIRNLLAMSADIYNEVLEYSDEKLNEKLLDRISYLTVRFYYEAGRNPKVKKFMERATLFDILKRIKTKEDYINYYHYMEGLVAFHRYYGGKD